MSAVLLALVLASAAEAPVRTLGPGEQVSYRVSWLGLPAGAAEVTVGAESAERPGALPVVTNGQCDLVVYPLREKVIAWWDPDSGRSRGVETYAEENHKRRRMKVEFDPRAGRAVVTRQTEGEPVREKQVDVPAGSLDVASAVFFLRMSALEDGAVIALPIFTGAKAFDGKATVEGRVPLETPRGTTPTVKVRFQTEFSGKLAARELRIWFTDDAAHVPVRMEADFVLGPVVVEWTDYKPGRPLDPSILARRR